LLAQPILVEGGYATVPDAPGLGFDLDRDAVEKFKTEKPERRPDPDRMVEVKLPDGGRLYVASNNEVNYLLNAANKELIPFYERGVTAELYADDGTAAWRELYESACKAPVLR
jgi:galactonate dehydratase